MSLIINSDSDGVVYDFNAVMTSRLVRRGYALDQTQWDFGLTRDEFLPEFHDAIYYGVFGEGDPIVGAVSAIKSLQRDHRVRIVTAKMFPHSERTLLAQSDTLAWYHKVGLANLEFVFTSGRYKASGYEADVVIDDKPTLEWRQRGALNLLFDQPWNAGLGPIELHHKGVKRVKGWGEVVAAIDNLAVSRTA